MQHNHPKISVITVVYNGEKHLEQTIKSVIAQNRQDVEHIIIDGDSTDSTMEIVEKYKTNIAKIISEPDNGIYDAMNKGAKIATGEYLAFLNADDWYKDGVLEKIIEETNLSKADFVYGGVLKVNNKNREDYEWNLEIKEKGKMPPHQATFVKKQAFDELGGFNTKYRFVADFDFIVRLFAKDYSTSYIDLIVANFRVGGASSEFWQPTKELLFINKYHLGIVSSLGIFCKRCFTYILFTKGSAIKHGKYTKKAYKILDIVFRLSALERLVKKILG